MSKCPWCGAEEDGHFAGNPTTVFLCGSKASAARKWQSQTCHIRELEAELAGVARLLAACREFGASDLAVDVECEAAAKRKHVVPVEAIVLKSVRLEAALRKLCREYATAKEKIDGPAD